MAQVANAMRWSSSNRVRSIRSTHAPTSADDESGWVLHPDQLRPGETAVFEFQIDEHQDKIAANVMLRLSTSPVGPCVPVPNASIVDAEAGVAGG